MVLYCAISKKVPEIPMISPLSGAVFEKHVIEEYLSKNGVDPFTGEELKMEDLIELKITPKEKSKLSSSTSVAAALMSKDEWDSPTIQTEQQQLQTTRQGKGKKSKKNKMQKVDPRFLGFSVTASEDRINVGNIDTV